MLQIQPSEAVMVGDWAERDVVGAAQVGMKTIFARYGNTFGTEISNANYDIDDISQVIDIVKEQNQKV
jgi:putative hydrolase of the HAD superfamily